MCIKLNIKLICGDQPQSQLKMWNVATKWWLSQISTTLCQQRMIGNITQPFYTNDLSWMVGRKTTFPSFHVLGVKLVCASFCSFVGGKNPEESCKVQFEGNLEPISRVYKELQPFFLLTLHPTTLLQLLIGNYENCKLLEEKMQEIILSRK